MRWLDILQLRLRALLHARELERELDEELAADPALRSAGEVALRERCREQRGWSGLDHLVHDAGRALRRLRRSPGFTCTAVLALAFGLAAATAIFGLWNAVLLRPLPGITDGHGLVHLERVDGGELLGDFSYPDYLDYAAQSRSYSSLAATSNFQLDVARPDGTETFNIDAVSGNFFTTLGVPAELGRVIAVPDELAHANRVVVVSDHFWRSRLHADPRAVGATLEGNRTPLTIIGVAAPGFAGASQNWSADLWVPITTQPFLLPMGSSGSCLQDRMCGWVTIVGRLRSDATLAQARAEAAIVAAGIAAAHPELKRRQADVVAGLGSWSDDRASHARILDTLLFGTFLLVAMTCISLGNLLLARLDGRQHELATELALGASPGRVARQVWFEAAWLTAAGGSAGVLAAAPAARWLLQLAPPSAPQNLSFALDARVLAFAGLLAALSGIAMALAPAWLVLRSARVAGALQQGGRSASARQRTQRTLLSLQLGLALVLLLGAGLAARTLQAATAGAVPPAAARTVLALVDTGHARYSRPQSAAFYARLQERLEAQPGLGPVALTSCLAPAPCNRGPVFVAGTEPSEAVVRAAEFGTASYPRPDISWVSPEFFRVFDLPLRAGRNFAASDRAGAALVCIINQRLAARLWPGQSALGRRLAWPQFSWTGDHDFTVVGIVADRRTQSLLAPPPMALYVPAAQAPFARMWIAAESALPQAAALGAIRAQVAALDPRIPAINGRNLADQVRFSIWQPLAIASLAGLFGLLAAAMAAIGLFGAVAQMVARRRRELGIRLALGASPGALVAMVLRDGLRPLTLGLGLGGLASALAARALRPWLFGVSAADPAAWAAAAALLALVTLLAAAAAAARAARLAPTAALRCD